MLFHPVKLREFLRIQIPVPGLHGYFEKNHESGPGIGFLKKIFRNVFFNTDNTSLK